MVSPTAGVGSKCARESPEEEVAGLDSTIAATSIGTLTSGSGFGGATFTAAVTTGTGTGTGAGAGGASIGGGMATGAAATMGAVTTSGCCCDTLPVVTSPTAALLFMFSIRSLTPAFAEA